MLYVGGAGAALAAGMPAHMDVCGARGVTGRADAGQMLGDGPVAAMAGHVLGPAPAGAWSAGSTAADCSTGAAMGGCIIGIAAPKASVPKGFGMDHMLASTSTVWTVVSVDQLPAWASSGAAQDPWRLDGLAGAAGAGAL